MTENYRKQSITKKDKKIVAFYNSNRYTTKELRNKEETNEKNFLQII